MADGHVAGPAVSAHHRVAMPMAMVLQQQQQDGGSGLRMSHRVSDGALP